MPFLPKIYQYFNCFRTCQPPTRVWECRMEFFGRRCRQPTFRTHALLVEPASRAPKNLGASKANTNNPMAACAAERNGMQSNNKRPVPACLSASALSMKTFSRKTGLKKITCQRKNTMPLKDDIIPKPRQIKGPDNPTCYQLL